MALRYLWIRVVIVAGCWLMAIFRVGGVREVWEGVLMLVVYVEYLLVVLLRYNLVAAAGGVVRGMVRGRG